MFTVYDETTRMKNAFLIWILALAVIVGVGLAFYETIILQHFETVYSEEEAESEEINDGETSVEEGTNDVVIEAELELMEESDI